MPRKCHFLKTETEYYKAVEYGDKTFEVRKNDRGFEVFDMVVLQEVANGIPTGRALELMEIVYILDGGKYGVEKGYCIMQLKKEF